MQIERSVISTFGCREDELSEGEFKQSEHLLRVGD
jgi:hypothetical protein